MISIKKLTIRAEELEDQLRVRVQKFANINVQPRVNALCDKYKINFISGMGTLFFLFDKEDKRSKILKIDHLSSFEDVCQIDEMHAEMERYPEEEWDFSKDDVEGLRVMEQEVKEMLTLLEVDVGFESGCDLIGHFCCDYDPSKK